MNIYYIIAICGFVLIFVAVLVYIFNNHNSNKPVTPSKTGCPQNLSQCGTGCYDKKIYACDASNMICNMDNYSQENNKCCISPEMLFNKTRIDEHGNVIKIGSECCNPDNWSTNGNTCCPIKVCGPYCCEKTEYCDHNILKNKPGVNPCTNCPTELCGTQCCDEKNNEQCYRIPNLKGPDTNICCNPLFWDSVNLICCGPSGCTGSTGSSGTTGSTGPVETPCGSVICNSQQTCINNETCCDNIFDDSGNPYKCLDQYNDPTCCVKNMTNCKKMQNGYYMCCDDGYTFDENSQSCFKICGNELCDPKEKICITVKDGSEEYSYCQSKNCQWQPNYSYDPPNFNNSNIIFSYNDKNETKYYYAIPDDANISTHLQRVSKVAEDQYYNKCTLSDCKGKISEEGSSTNYDIQDDICMGFFNSKGIKEFQPISTNPKCPLDSSCVKDANNKYTGQICMNSAGSPQLSYNGPVPNTFNLNKGDCICNSNDDEKLDNCKKIDKSNCSNHGYPNFVTGLCECSDPTNYKGDKCQCYKDICNQEGDIIDCQTCKCYPLACKNGTCSLNTNFFGYGNGSIENGWNGKLCNIPPGYTTFVPTFDSQGHFVSATYTGIPVNEVEINLTSIIYVWPFDIPPKPNQVFVYLILMPGITIFDSPIDILQNTSLKSKSKYYDPSIDYLDENHYILDKNIASYKGSAIPIRTSLICTNMYGDQPSNINLNLNLGDEGLVGIFYYNIQINITNSSNPEDGINQISVDPSVFFGNKPYTNYKIFNTLCSTTNPSTTPDTPPLCRFHYILLGI